MTRNVGTLDRILRAGIGIVLLALVFIGPQTLWGLVGLVPLATAFVGFCPAYRLLGLCTLAGNRRKA
ncbi:YgaP family membrane protein [Pelagibius sp.]|uniref:YgaP family membrane protein n=1 Tax=Pelagibius sp. TaxID=1931238 RepID=UPI003B506173